MATIYGSLAYRELNANVPEWGDMQDDESVKVNHHTCMSGEDTRKRFGVKRVDGAYLFHCFNCGQSGYYRQRETISRIKLETALHASPLFLDDIHYVYNNSKTNYDEFDLRGQLWLGQYGFDSYMCETYQIRECEQGIILPIIKMFEAIPVGYQIRRYDRKPKYVTHRGKAKAQYLKGNLFKPLVVVEDLLSSYKLHFAGYSTLCLMGTSLNLKTVEELAIDRSERVVLWLDDDDAGHSATLKLFIELSPLFSGGVTSINMQQPKEIELEKLLELDL
jgi:hypothetical protein